MSLLERRERLFNIASDPAIEEGPEKDYSVSGAWVKAWSTKLIMSRAQMSPEHEQGNTRSLDCARRFASLSDALRSG